jgi:hypothetical protein
MHSCGSICKCLYICIHCCTYTHTYIHTHTYPHIQRALPHWCCTYTHTYIHTYTHTHTHIPTHTESTPSLMLLPEGEHITAAACGSFHTFLLSKEGDVYACGHNRHGQLGLGHKLDTTIPEKLNLKGRYVYVCIDLCIMCTKCVCMRAQQTWAVGIGS